MKFTFIAFCLLLNLSSAFARPLTQLKIDFDWKIKFDSTEWDYTYFKEAQPISSHIFEHKVEKFRLILQKETHLNPNISNSNLVSDQCSQANKHYSAKFGGKAQVIQLNKTETCYVEYKKKGNILFHQFLIPENTKKTSYELFSYTWNSESTRSKELVEKFLKGFLK